MKKSLYIFVKNVVPGFSCRYSVRIPNMNPLEDNCFSGKDTHGKN